MPRPKDEEEEFKVDDRRHWAVDEAADEAAEVEVEPRKPTLVDQYRLAAEAAEAKLQEYIEAFKQHQQEQDDLRARLERDVDRRVELKFGNLVGQLLETADTLDLSLSHVRDVPEAEPLVEGVAMARDGFLATLQRNGIEKIYLEEGTPFDPNEAEAVRVDPVDRSENDGTVTETLQPGYRLGELIIRAARVAVGRFNRS